MCFIFSFNFFFSFYFRLGLSKLIGNWQLAAAQQHQTPPNLESVLGLRDGDVSPPPSSLDLSNSQKKTCPYCFQQLSWHALSRHIRDMHRAKTGLVTCEFCQKTFRNKNSLGCHKWRFHKDSRDNKEQATPTTAASATPPVFHPEQGKALSSSSPPALPVIPVESPSKLTTKDDNWWHFYKQNTQLVTK